MDIIAASYFGRYHDKKISSYIEEAVDFVINVLFWR